MARGRELTGLKIAITGGARGIGQATAARLSAGGAEVVIGDLDESLAHSVADGLGITALPLDVTDAASWQAFVEQAGTLDVLVNNAGIMPLGSILKEPDQVTRAIVGVNLYGVVLGTKAAAPGMVERGSGQLVNVASAVGRVAVAGGATYSASKFAVVGFTEATRAELAPHGVEVGMVLPSVVRTELAAGLADPRGVAPVTPEDVAAVIEQMIRRPRAEMWVPRWAQGLAKGTSVLPRRLQERVAHAFKADAILSDVDEAARAAYEARVRPPS